MQPQIDFTPGGAPDNLDFTPSLTPDQSKAALGVANNSLMDTLKRSAQMVQGVPYVGPALGAAGDMGTGAAKSLFQHAAGLGQMGAQAMSNIRGPLGQAFRQKAQQDASSLQQPGLAPQGLMQKIGAGAESAGEFFAPGGIEKAVLEKVPQLGGMAGEALNLAAKAGMTGTSMGAVTAAQTGGDPTATRQAFGMGVMTQGLAAPLEYVAPGIMKYLMKSDFRLTPTQEAKTVKIAEDAANFMAQNKILGSNPTKFRKLSKITTDFEGMLQTSLPEDFSIPKANIVQNLQENLKTLPVDQPSEEPGAVAKANEAMKTLEKVPGDTIKIKDVLKGKRDWGSKAFSLAEGSKRDPEVSGVGAYAVESAYQKAIEDKLAGTMVGSGFEMPGFDAPTSIKIAPKYQSMFGGQSQVSLPEFNKVYSNAINARNLAGVAQYRNDAGLFGTMFGLWVGKSIGQALLPGLGGELGGAAVGEIAAKKLVGGARNVSERILAHPDIIPGTAKVGEGLSRSLGQGDTGQAGPAPADMTSTN